MASAATPALFAPLLAPLLAPVRALVDLVLPPRCPACRAMTGSDGGFCPDCFRAVTAVTAPWCARCGLPFEHDMGPAAECAPCLAEPPRFDTARSAALYGGPVRSAVLAFKHGDRPHLARMMAPGLMRVGAGVLGADALLVPVPLHRWRLWRRGYNQAAELARAVSRLSGTPLALDVLTRVKPTPISRGLGREARIRNVRGAFRVADRAAVKGRRIVLVDDVLTTGATVDACARVLRRAGAARVDVLTFARVTRNEDHHGQG